MPRDTDLPERILDLIERASDPLTVKEVAEKLAAKERTVDPHLRALYEKHLLCRDFIYPDGGHHPIGRYVYFARGKNKAPASRG